MSQKNDEYEYYKLGAEHFGYNIEALDNKYEYKQEHFLNTGICQIRKRSLITIITSCIASMEYLKALMPKDSVGFIIYYNDSRVDIEELQVEIEANVDYVYVETDLRPFLKEYETIVLANGDTIICDYKEFGLRKKKGTCVVYRIKNREKYKTTIAIFEKMFGVKI